MTRLSAPTEQNIQRSIIEYLRYCRWAVIRLNSGGLPDSQGRLVRFIDIGDPTLSVVDLLAIPPAGSSYPRPCLWIEVKRPGWKPSGNPRSTEAQRWERQNRFLAEMERRGHGGIVAYSLDDVIQAIEEKAA